MSAYLSASAWQQEMLPFGKGEVGFWQEGDSTKNSLLSMLGLSFLLDIQVVIPSETFEQVRPEFGVREQALGGDLQ